MPGSEKPAFFARFRMGGLSRYISENFIRLFLLGLGPLVIIGGGLFFYLRGGRYVTTLD